MSCDLHCHTKISDGSMGIEETIAMAKRRGMTAIAVTDHDTTASATRATVIGKRHGIQVVHGVEFSTTDKQRGNSAHILCYLCDTPGRLEGLCRRIGESRKKATSQMVGKVMRYYPVNPEMVVKCATGSTNVFKQHIMHALMDAGYADSIFGEVYDKLFAKDSGAARVEIDYPDTREVIDAVHEAGGIAVLAHPYQYNNIDLMQELAENGLDGIEVWTPDHSEQQTHDLEDFADHQKLIKTGGSDFHGMYTRHPHPLGSVTMSDEALKALFAYKEALA